MPSSRTHIGFGMTGLIILSYKLNQYGIFYDKLDTFTGVLLGCTFPDLDSGTSWISSAIPWIDDYLRKIKILRHRGILHSIFTLIIFIILPIYALYNYWYHFHFILSFSVGVISHICLDFFTSKIFRIRCGDKGRGDNPKDEAFIDIGFKETWLYNIIWIINVLIIISLRFNINYKNLLIQFFKFFILKFS